MIKSPKVSVITTVYNTENLFNRCFESLLAQTYENIEIIIVNNGSHGDIKSLVAELQKAYEDKKICYVELEKNVGLFHGRLEGISKATGQYIAFIDSDDTVSIDYYRVLVNKALETKADIVASDVVLEMEDGGFFCNELSPFHYKEMDMNNDELMNNFYGQEGRCFYWNLVWNKLYSKDLVEKALPYFKKIPSKVVMCDDMLFSSIFNFMCKRYVTDNNCQYFYYKNSQAYTATKASLDRYKSNIQDVVNVFSYMRENLELFDKQVYFKNLDAWRNRYYRIWCTNVVNAGFTKQQFDEISMFIRKKFRKVELDFLSESDQFYYKNCSSFSLKTESVIKAIRDPQIKCVSFDIFDTLLVRDVFSPDDVFKLMEVRFTELMNSTLTISFSKMRKTAEASIRQKLFKQYKHEEVTIDEIYQEMQVLYGLEQAIIEEVKRYECELEAKLNHGRRFGKYLFDLAKYLNKKVILVSDMYLKKEFIQSLLHKSGICNYDYLFISSDYRKTKHNGTLYEVVLAEIKMLPERILHIGDNLHSDFNVPNSLGFNALHIPKVGDLLTDHGSNFYHDVVLSTTGEGRKGSSLAFSTPRMALALIANKQFDNPFLSKVPGTYFDNNPYLFGYSLLGPYMLGLYIWLQRQIRDFKYSRVHFISRDGYLLKQVCEIMGLPENVSSNYLFASRKSMLPLMIRKAHDIYTLDSVIKVEQSSPQQILSLLTPIVAKKNLEDIFTLNKLSFTETFKEYENFIKFCHIYVTKIHDQVSVDIYRQRMSKYFSSMFKLDGHDCLFDIGYSGRTERLLGDLLNTKINVCYLNINSELALNNLAGKFEMRTVYEYSPSHTGALRETLLSEYTASCIGYSVDDRTSVYPVFEQKSKNFVSREIVQNVQLGAIAFIKDFSKYSDDYLSLNTRVNDLLWWMDGYFSHSGATDYCFFSQEKFEDDLSTGGESSLVDFILREKQHGVNGHFSNFNDLKYWWWPTSTLMTKVIVLWLIDRGLLKTKVKTRMQVTSPRLFKSLSWLNRKIFKF